MKRYLVVLALFAAPVSAESQYSFAIEENVYVLLESSLHLEGPKGNQAIVALWEVTTPQLSERWKTSVSGCTSPIGVINIYSRRGVNSYNWSWDGGRAYDFMAGASCAAVLGKAKPLTRM